MANLIELQSQIEKLQKQANDIKAKEFAATVQDILAKMQAFGITVKDLQTSNAKGRTKGKRIGKAIEKTLNNSTKSLKRGRAVAPKYRGPSGETWSGRGLTPKWLAALIEQGQSKDIFLIK